MNRLEHTARLLAGLGTGSPDLEPGIRSARRSLAWSSELAAAAAGAGRGPERIAWVRHAGDDESEHMLEITLTVHALKWPGVKELTDRQKLRATSMAAIEEWLRPPRCRKCRGTGNVYQRVQGRVAVTDCDACHGHGTVALSGRARARRVGIPKSTWFDNAAAIYDRMLGTLDNWNIRLLEHVHRQLRD